VSELQTNSAKEAIAMSEHQHHRDIDREAACLRELASAFAVDRASKKLAALTIDVGTWEEPLPKDTVANIIRTNEANGVLTTEEAFCLAQLLPDLFAGVVGHAREDLAGEKGAAIAAF
jgi:hypothetical protein